MAKIAGNTAPHLKDRSLWAEAVRDVRPLPGRSAPVLPSAPNLPSCAPETPAFVPAPDPPPIERFAGIDRANAERLKRGQHPIEARLDLHGLTQDEAHRALAVFIRGARAGG